ncbi:MAG: hypothetical protein ACYC3Q_03100 [Gemmatimonadaceae bacterium]
MTSRRFVLLGSVVLLVLAGLGALAYRVRPLPATPVPTASIEWTTLGRYLPGLPSTLVESSPEREIASTTHRDPFGPPVTSESVRPEIQPSRSAPRPTPAKGSSWVVTAILITGTHRTAVVNDAVVTVGSVLADGSRIRTIEQGAVTLQDSTGRIHTIRVRPGAE